ncbi:hypothetical protein [Escherichia phage UPEC06]|nr:hypothetical protein [Escherichia phage UPEC06]
MSIWKNNVPATNKVTFTKTEIAVMVIATFIVLVLL